MGHGRGELRPVRTEWRNKAERREALGVIQYCSWEGDKFRAEKDPQKTCLSLQGPLAEVFYCNQLLETGHLSTSVPCGKRVLSGVTSLLLHTDATISMSSITTHYSWKFIIQELFPIF